MIECFNEGSEETNLLRRRLGLEAMAAPWHNRFFNLHEVKSWSSPKFYVERVFHISSTYHFLSRVVYAKLARSPAKRCATTRKSISWRRNYRRRSANSGR